MNKNPRTSEQRRFHDTLDVSRGMQTDGTVSRNRKSFTFGDAFSMVSRNVNVPRGLQELSIRVAMIHESSFLACSVYRVLLFSQIVLRTAVATTRALHQCLGPRIVMSVVF